MKRRDTGWLIHWVLGWHQPYTEPGKVPWSDLDFTGWPREILEWRLSRGEEPASMPDWYKPGCGWSMFWRGPIPPADFVPRKLSLESKQKMRRGNLKRRVEKAAPLFADQFIGEALKDEDYYGQNDIQSRSRSKDTVS